MPNQKGELFGNCDMFHIIIVYVLIGLKQHFKL